MRTAAEVRPENWLVPSNAGVSGMILSPPGSYSVAGSQSGPTVSPLFSRLLTLDPCPHSEAGELLGVVLGPWCRGPKKGL